MEPARNAGKVKEVVYRRHRPEQTLLYQLVEQYYPEFEELMARQAGCTHGTARTGAVTFIQRFGSALNLNIHFHILFLDGVYLAGGAGHQPVFRPGRAPCKQELETLLHQISTRLARFLVKEGVLKIIAGIEDPAIIEKILRHLRAKEAGQAPRTNGLPPTRAPPEWPVPSDIIQATRTMLSRGVAGARTFRSREQGVFRGS